MVYDQEKNLTEPLWLPPARVLRSRVPAGLMDWLLDASSLTRRVQGACTGRFEVQVLDAGWRRPMLNEQRARGLRHGVRALVREVHLVCAGEPWVFARTVIPVSTLTGRRRRLRYLGSRPLGAFLFADRSMTRGGVEVARIGAGERLYARATRSLSLPPPAIWGRRSVFRLGGKPLLVSEIFLRVGSGSHVGS
jgi:chorismate--pyruvate lyase